MKDRSFEYPCILDPMRGCPTECKLHMNSVRVILSIANRHGKTPEEEAEMLRSGTKELETFRRMNAAALLESDAIAKCSHYPDSLAGITDLLDKDNN